MNATRIIKSLRAKNNLTQDQTAKLLGISRQAYNLLENNILNNELNLIFKLLKVLDSSSNELREFLDALQQDYVSYNEQ